jgi:hypothetical protein
MVTERTGINDACQALQDRGRNNTMKCKVSSPIVDLASELRCVDTTRENAITDPILPLQSGSNSTLSAQTRHMVRLRIRVISHSRNGGRIVCHLGRGILEINQKTAIFANRMLNVPAVRSTLTIARRLVTVCPCSDPEGLIPIADWTNRDSWQKAFDCAHECYVTGGPDH